MLQRTIDSCHIVDLVKTWSKAVVNLVMEYSTQKYCHIPYLGFDDDALLNIPQIMAFMVCV